MAAQPTAPIPLPRPRPALKTDNWQAFPATASRRQERGHTARARAANAARRHHGRGSAQPSSLPAGDLRARELLRASGRLEHRGRPRAPRTPPSRWRWRRRRTPRRSISSAVKQAIDLVRKSRLDEATSAEGTDRRPARRAS